MSLLAWRKAVVPARPKLRKRSLAAWRARLPECVCACVYVCVLAFVRVCVLVQVNFKWKCNACRTRGWRGAYWRDQYAGSCICISQTCLRGQRRISKGRGRIMRIMCKSSSSPCGNRGEKKFTCFCVRFCRARHYTSHFLQQLLRVCSQHIAALI